MREGYKETAIGIIPEDWDFKSIGSIATVVRGASPRPKGDLRYYGGNIPRLMVEDVTRDGKYVHPHIDFLTDEGARRSRLMKAGTLVMVCSGTVGVPAILKVDACVHDGFLAFPELSDTCSLDFLFYIFSSFKEEFNSSATHGGIFTNLTTTIIKEFQIPLPSLNEQTKIAFILSTVDDKINAINERIAQTQQLKNGLMQRLLTKGIGHTKFKDSTLGEIPENWDDVKLGDCLEKVVGGGTPSRTIESYWKGEIPWATVKDLKKSILDNTEECITEIGLKNSASNLIPRNTIIIATRMALGKAVFFTKDVAINQDLKAIFTKPLLIENFLFHWFALNAKKIEELGSGSTVKGIRLEVLRALDLALPPISEQQGISVILSNVDEKLDVLLEKKAEYEKLKKGLMQKLLTGQIRVNTIN